MGYVPSINVINVMFNFFRYRYNNSEAFYEPLLGEYDGFYLKENNEKVSTETSDDVAYADV